MSAIRQLILRTGCRDFLILTASSTSPKDETLRTHKNEVAHIGGLVEYRDPGGSYGRGQLVHSSARSVYSEE